MATTNGVLKYRLVEMKDPIDAEASKNGTLALYKTARWISKIS